MVKDINSVNDLVNQTVKDILLELTVKARNARCEVPMECLKIVKEITEEKILKQETYEKYLAILK